LRLALVAVAVLVASFVPLLVVGFLDPAANPVGLGLLSIAGTFVALLLLAIAVLRAAWRWMRRPS
jgi:hypothetical protein